MNPSAFRCGPRLAALWAIVAGLGLVNCDWDVTGKPCDDDNPCLDGFVCVADACLVDDGAAGEGEGEGEGEPACLPSVIGSTSGQVSGSGLSLSQPAGTEVGDTLVAVVVVGDRDTVIGEVSEWTRINTITNNTVLGMRVYARTATATAATYTFPTGSTPGSGGMVGLRCVTTTGIVSASETSTGDMAAPTVIPTASNSLLVTLFGSLASDAAHNTPEGMTAAFASPIAAFRSTGFTEALTSTVETGARAAGSARNRAWIAVSLVLSPQP